MNINEINKITTIKKIYIEIPDTNIFMVAIKLRELRLIIEHDKYYLFNINLLNCFVNGLSNFDFDLILNKRSIIQDNLSNNSYTYVYI